MTRTAPLLAALALTSLTLTACSSGDDVSSASESPQVSEAAPVVSAEAAGAEAAAKSDAKALAVALETYYLDGATYPSSQQMSNAKFVQSLRQGIGLKLVKGNTIVGYAGDSSSYSYCITARATGAWALMDSAEGLVGSGTEDATCERAG